MVLSDDDKYRIRGIDKGSLLKFLSNPTPDFQALNQTDREHYVIHAIPDDPAASVPACIEGIVGTSHVTVKGKLDPLSDEERADLMEALERELTDIYLGFYGGSSGYHVYLHVGLGTDPEFQAKLAYASLTDAAPVVAKMLNLAKSPRGEVFFQPDADGATAPDLDAMTFEIASVGTGLPQVIHSRTVPDGRACNIIGGTMAAGNPLCRILSSGQKSAYMD